MVIYLAELLGLPLVACVSFARDDSRLTVDGAIAQGVVPCKMVVLEMSALFTAFFSHLNLLSKRFLRAVTPSPVFWRCSCMDQSSPTSVRMTRQAQRLSTSGPGRRESLDHSLHLESSQPMKRNASSPGNDYWSLLLLWFKLPAPALQPLPLGLREPTADHHFMIQGILF